MWRTQEAILNLNYNMLWLRDGNKAAILAFRYYGELDGNFKPNS
jgi:hypothetical protein